MFNDMPAYSQNMAKDKSCFLLPAALTNTDKLNQLWVQSMDKLLQPTVN